MLWHPCCTCRSLQLESEVPAWKEGAPELHPLPAPLRVSTSCRVSPCLSRNPVWVPAGCSTPLLPPWEGQEDGDAPGSRKELCK